mmetsp:Transcript_68997/g.223034  ORF Transcript_68997/g.223034 Transcript_68997/m.223034 type:complete len:246 (+) Transcript_68997:441-1178(+)
MASTRTPRLLAAASRSWPTLLCNGSATCRKRGLQAAPLASTAQGPSAGAGGSSCGSCGRSRPRTLKLRRSPMGSEASQGSNSSPCTSCNSSSCAPSCAAAASCTLRTRLCAGSVTRSGGCSDHEKAGSSSTRTSTLDSTVTRMQGQDSSVTCAACHSMPLLVTRSFWSISQVRRMTSSWRPTSEKAWYMLKTPLGPSKPCFSRIACCARFTSLPKLSLKPRSPRPSGNGYSSRRLSRCFWNHSEP